MVGKPSQALQSCSDLILLLHELHSVTLGEGGPAEAHCRHLLDNPRTEPSSQDD